MKKHIGVMAIMVATASLTLVGSASAEERTCRGTINAVTVDNLLVPANATCTLNGTRVKGTVKVENGATLTATRVDVIGNVQSEGHRSVTVRNSRVGGSIQVKQGGGATVAANRVTGDVQFFTNRGAIAVNGNTINGNLQC